MNIRLKESCPELKFILSVFNGMILDGNKVTVCRESLPGSDWLRVRVHRCKKYAYVELMRAIYPGEQTEFLRNLAGIHLFRTDIDGTFIEIVPLDEWDEMVDTLEVPDINIRCLDDAASGYNPMVTQLALRKPFPELEHFAKVCNLMLARGCYFRMTVRNVSHAEFYITDGEHDFRPTLALACGLKRRSYSADDAEDFGKVAVSFNRLLSRRDTVYQKFYYRCSPPSLEIRTL